MNDGAWEVYIIKTSDGKLYTGITKDMMRRFSEHSSKQKGAKFFHFASPEKIVYRQSFESRGEATKREIAIKKLTRLQKLDLILEQNLN